MWSIVFDSVTPCTATLQVPPSMEFSRQEYWNRLPFPLPGGLPDPGTEPESPALAVRFFTTEPPGKPAINFQHWPILNWLFLWIYLLPLSLEIMSFPLCWPPSHPPSGWSLPDLMLFPFSDTHSFFTKSACPQRHLPWPLCLQAAMSCSWHHILFCFTTLTTTSYIYSCTHLPW